MAIRCRCPPDRRWPRSPIIVSYPWSSRATNSSACAARAAASIASRPASGRPYATLAAIVSSKSTVSCVTMLICDLSEASVTSRTSWPSTRIAPPVTS
jgi:hypothetical protein